MKVKDPDWGQRQIIEATPEEDALMPRCSHSTRSNGDNATIHNVQRVIPQIVARCKQQTERLADYLYDRDLLTYCRNIWTYLFNHIQYRYDEDGIEQFRTPARAWADRHEGIDCDCFSIFVSCLLANRGIPHGLRITKYGNHDDWQHIYVIVPRNGRTLDEDDPRTYIVIDCVLHQFDVEKYYKTQNTTFMNGLGIPTQTLQGLGGSADRFMDRRLSGLQSPIARFMEKTVKGIDGLGDLSDDDDNENIDDETMSWDDVRLQIEAEREFASKFPNTYNHVNTRKTTAAQFVAMADYALENWDDEEKRRTALAILGENEKMIDGDQTPQQAKANIAKIQSGETDLSPVDSDLYDSDAMSGAGLGLTKTEWRLTPEMVESSYYPSYVNPDELEKQASSSDESIQGFGAPKRLSVTVRETPQNPDDFWDADCKFPKPTASGDFFIRVKNEHGIETFTWKWHKPANKEDMYVEVWTDPSSSSENKAQINREKFFYKVQQGSAKRIQKFNQNHPTGSFTAGDNSWDKPVYLDCLEAGRMHYFAILPPKFGGVWAEIIDYQTKYFNYDGTEIASPSKEITKAVGQVDKAAERNAMKLYRKQALEEADGFWKKLGLLFKFALQTLAHYSLLLTAARGGFLLFLRWNLFGLARKLHPAVAQTQTQQSMYTDEQKQIATAAWEKLQKVWRVIGGYTPSAMRNAINNGYGQKQQGKLIKSVESMNGMGEMFTAAATVAEVILAMTPYVSAICSCIAAIAGAAAAIKKAAKTNGLSGCASDYETAPYEIEAEIYCADAKLCGLGYVSGLAGEDDTDEIVEDFGGEKACDDTVVDENANKSSKFAEFFKKLIQWIVNLFKKKKEGKEYADEMESENQGYTLSLSDGTNNYSYNTSTRQVKVTTVSNDNSSNTSNNTSSSSTPKPKVTVTPASNSTSSSASNNNGGSQVDYSNYNNYYNNSEMEENNQQEESFFKKHKTALIIGGVVLAAAAVGGGFYLYNKKKKAEEAATPALTGFRRKRRKSPKTKAVKTLKAY